MATLMLLVLLVSAAAIFYAYAGFPLLLAGAALIMRKTVRQGAIRPRVSILVAAYNEQNSIGQRLDNLLATDYPRELLDIIVVSDGSTDCTNAIVASYQDRGVRLLALPRMGKNLAIKEAMPHCQGEILVFSDANTAFAPQAVQRLVRNFADPQVGGVCGNQIYADAKKQDGLSGGEKLYWNFDKAIKRLETLTGSIVSADGAIYAIRRRLYQESLSAAVTDDFFISTAVVEQGYRLVLEPEAIAYEEVAGSATDEFHRKVRIINRGLYGVYLRRRLLNPLRYGFYAVTLFSHKVIRRLVPFFLLSLLLASLVLAGLGQPLFVGLAGLQLLFYALAAIGYGLRDTALGRLKVLYVPSFYCMANLAALIAVARLLAGRKVTAWQPRRPAAAPGP